ncbi:ThuA domain-containing protein [Brevundimonas sp.]|uniref:ThuA domain-containing protein n=1 Tax=Brevundimonas sp. TaxID=1871086 RepID=UPI003919AFE1
MIHRRQALLGVGAAALAVPSIAHARPRRAQRVLYLSQSAGWLHDVVARPDDGGLAMSELAMTEIGRASGAFTTRATQDASEITSALLAEMDVLVVYTTGALPIPRQSWQAIQAWLASGRGGFVGLHSAADTGMDFPGGREAWVGMVGGDFAGHPWNQGDPIRVRTHGDHPTVAMWPDAFDYREEIYQYRGFDPTRVRVLQSLDLARTPTKRPWAVPVTWVRQIGHGRLFYTNLGHTPSTWSDPRFRDQIVQAVQWAGGAGRVDADPNPVDQAVDAIAALLAWSDDDPAMAQGLTGQRPAWLLDMGRRISALIEHEGDDADLTAAAAPLRREVLARA